MVSSMPHRPEMAPGDGPQSLGAGCLSTHPLHEKGIPFTGKGLFYSSCSGYPFMIFTVEKSIPVASNVPAKFRADPTVGSGSDAQQPFADMGLQHRRTIPETPER